MLSNHLTEKEEISEKTVKLHNINREAFLRIFDLACLPLKTFQPQTKMVFDGSVTHKKLMLSNNLTKKRRISKKKNIQSRETFLWYQIGE